MSIINLNLKEGTKGIWSLSKFTITQHEAEMHMLRCIVNRCPSRSVLPGTYWKLKENNTVYMTNTPAEVKDHMKFIREAHGNVLIAGLGLGMVVQALLDRGNCEHITVVELSQDVIDLVGPCYTDPRIEIVQSDIFKFKPKMHYDYGWFDIWPNICADNFPQMQKLHRKFAKHIDKRMSWCYKECRQMCKEDW